MASYANLPRDLKQEVSSYLDLDAMIALRKADKTKLIPTVDQCCIEATPQEIAALMIDLRASYLNPRTQNKKRSRISLIVDKHLINFSIDWIRGEHNWQVFDPISIQYVKIKDEDLVPHLKDARFVLPDEINPLYVRDILKKRKVCLQNPAFLKECFDGWLVNYFTNYPFGIVSYTNAREWYLFYDTLELLLPKDYEVMKYFKLILPGYTHGRYSYMNISGAELVDMVVKTLDMLQHVNPEDYKL